MSCMGCRFSRCLHLLSGGVGSGCADHSADVISIMFGSIRRKFTNVFTD